MSIKFISEDQIEVTLEAEIVRGKTKTHQVILTRPKTRLMGNISQIELMNQNVRALTTILPKMTTPTLLKEEYGSMSWADSSLLGTAVSLFFMTSAQRKAVMGDIQEAFLPPETD